MLLENPQKYKQFLTGHAGCGIYGFKKSYSRQILRLPDVGHPHAGCIFKNSWLRINLKCKINYSYDL